MIEILAVPLYYRIGMMGDEFSYTSRLYGVWKNEIKFLPKSDADRLERLKEKETLYNKK
jgi:hypothetical protein